MKTIKRLLAILALLSCLVIVLCSCNDSDVPEGMQLCSNPKSDGYSFYAPEGYLVTRSGDVITALVSELDPTTVSAYLIYPTEATVADYWSANRAGLSDLCDEETDITFEVEDSPVNVGDKEGHAYIYSFIRGGVNYKVTQIIVTKTNLPSDGTVLITYTGKMDETVTGTVGYRDHYDEFETVLTYFTFTDATEPKSEPAPNTKRAPEGMQLASNPKISYYSLYVPVEWKVDSETGISSAYSIDGKVGASVISNYPEGVSTVDEYYAQQKDNLTATGYTVVTESEEVAENLTVGGCDAFRYNGYLTNKSGETIRYSVVYILLRSGLHRGLYTVTLTALGNDTASADTLFEANENDFESILSSFAFGN